MHVLRDAESINAEINSCADPHMKQLIADRAEFVRNEVDASEGEYDDIGELINFILVEPGDTPQDIDAEMDGTFLMDPYGGRRFGDPAFVPPFETMEEHPTYFPRVAERICAQFPSRGKFRGGGGLPGR